MDILPVRGESTWSSGESAMDSDRIKILFIIDYFHRTGGTEKHLAQLIAGLPAELFHCSVVAFDLGKNPLLDGLRVRGVPIISLPVGRVYVPNAAVQARRLSTLIRSDKYDIVQTFHQKADSFGAVIAWLSGVKHLVSSKRDTGQLRRPWHVFLNRRLRSMFERVIVVGDAVAAAVTANDRIDPVRIVKIYNGVDTVRFSPPAAADALEARRSLGFAQQDFVIGMVAGFRPEKCYDVFFDGLSRALGRIPSLKAIAVGAGPLLDHFRGVCTRGPLRNKVTFTGDTVDVGRYLWAMDVGCLVSGNEGFSNAVLEKMAVGLPMIVTAVGGNAEAVVHGVSGFVIPPFDAEAFCEALVAIHADPAKRAAMGHRSRQLVEEKFSLDWMCAQHAQLYLSLCDPARGQ